MAGLKRSRVGFILINLASFVIVVAGMRAASTILVQILLAAFLAIIVSPIFFFLQWGPRKYKAKNAGKGPIMKPVFALLIIIGGLVLFGFFIVSAIGNSIASFTKNLPMYQRLVQENLTQLFTWLEGKGMQIPEGTARELFDPQVVFSFARTTFGAVSNMLGQGLVILLIATFFLLEAARLPLKVRAVAGHDEESYRSIQGAVEMVRHYMGVKTLICLLTGFLVWVLALSFRLDYAILLAFLAFAFNYIPTIGSFMAAVPGVILALVQFGPGRALGVAIAYTVINVGIGNILEPRSVGIKIGLSPAVVLISLLFWGWVLGPIGMLLSVPLTMSVKIALLSLDKRNWIALLLGSTVPPDPEAED